MKTLVVGSAGYVGSVLLPVLRREGIQVTELDLLWFSERNGRIPLDIRVVDYGEVLEGCDSVVYLAAVSNDPMGKQFEQVTHDINTAACLDLAAAARRLGVKRFVFASSCSMYGDATEAPRKESDELRPLTAYARSKVSTEIGLQALADDRFSVTSLRFATACGASENLRLDLVLNDFVASAITKKKIEILSDGTPWRPLIHVEDMARAISWALKERGGANFTPVNIGSNEWTFTIRDLAERVRDFIPNVDVTLNKHASPDKRSYRVDFSKFKELAPESQPIVTLEDAVRGLQKQIAKIDFGITNDFRFSMPYIRLQTLNNHLSENRLDSNLRWISS